MKKLFAALLTFILIIPSTAFADDATLGGLGETVYPVFDSNVVMERETVDITVKDGKSFVTCNFYLKNTGKSTKLLMGFPSFSESNRLPGWEQDIPEEDLIYGDLNLYNFRAFAAGKRLRVTTRHGMKNAGNNTDENYFPVWYCWNLRLKAGEAKKITNSYWCYNWAGGESNWQAVQYILTTGAFWKDVIGKITVRIKMAEKNPYFTDFFNDPQTDFVPDYYTESGTLVWERENTEPDKDIFIYLDSEPASDLFIHDSDTGHLTDYLKRMYRHFRKKHYNSTLWWGNVIAREYDVQTEAFHYLMGAAYYYMHLYNNALQELDKSGKKGLYYKAMILKKLGRDEEYLSCIREMASLEDKADTGLKLWGQSRLKDIAIE